MSLELDKKDKIEKFSSILYVLIPSLLITGPFLPDLMVVVISLLFLYKVILNKKFLIFNNNFFFLFILFYLILLTSSFFSEYSDYSFKRSVPYLRFGFFSLAVFMLLTYNEKIIKYLTLIFLLILSGLFIDSIFEFIFNKNILGWKKIDNNFRITSFFGDDEVLGSYVARFFPFVISLILFSKQQFKFKINNLILSFSIIISFIITFISGERTALAIIIMSIFLMLFSCKDLRKIISASLILIIFFSSIILILKPKLKERFYDQVISQMGISKSEESIKIFSKTYEGHYIIAFNMFKEKPLIGHGVKSFRKYCSEPENFLYEHACTTHPHNIYMQLLAETGIFGFALVFLVFIFSLIKIIKLTINSFYSQKDLLYQSRILVYVFFFVNLFPFLPSGNLFNNWLSTIYFMPVGYLIYLNKFKLN